MTEKVRNHRATCSYPLRRVIESRLTWTGNPHQPSNCPGSYHFLDELLECGHRIEVRPIRPAKRRRCFDCRERG